MEMRPAMRHVILLALLAAACSASQEPLVKDGPLDGTPEDTTPGNPTGPSVSPAGIPIGTKLWATTNVNLRKGASTDDAVIHVIPQDDMVVTVNRTTALNGFWNVKHSGVEGWAYGTYLTMTPPTTQPPPSTGGGDGAVTLAKSGIGFSYWWGHGRWLTTGPTQQIAGTCSGNCPSCTHGGSYGADCSGFVAKLWQVPSSNSDVSVDSHPYSTYNFFNQTTHWKVVDRANLQPGDALVYNDGSAGHVFLYEKGDGWGSMWASEAKGCSYGIVHNLRTAPSTYKAIRRDGW